MFLFFNLSTFKKEFEAYCIYLIGLSRLAWLYGTIRAIRKASKYSVRNKRNSSKV